VKDELLALLESQIPKPIAQALKGCQVRASVQDDSDTIDTGLLRFDCKRRGEERKNQAGCENRS
jgi:hypothetical protein